MLTDCASFGTDDESLNRLYEIRELPKYVVPADFARTLERSLAERTEERDKLLEKQSWLIAHPTAIEAAHQVVEWTKCEQDRDDALAKIAAVTAERDALKHALIELEAAAEAYAADQSRATDSRCGLVQPITVEDGNRLLSALKAANELSAIPRLGGEQ